MKRRDVKSSKRVLRSTLHVFCEGKESEKNYIELFLELFCNSSKCVKIEDRSHTDPKGLVAEAVNLKRMNSVSFPDDEYWAVYDRESPAKYPEKIHKQALQNADSEGIHVALSNVCFEVWLLLHKGDHDLKCNTFDELRKSPRFKSLFPKYDKGRKFNFSKEQIIYARKLAISMNKRTLNGADREVSAAQPYKLNPYTTFPELLTAIEDFIIKNCKNTTL